jgi:hypothetical protein
MVKMRGCTGSLLWSTDEKVRRRHDESLLLWIELFSGAWETQRSMPDVALRGKETDAALARAS